MTISGRAAAKTPVSLGTATPGGGFPLYGAAVVDVINALDPALAVEARTTRGSTENVPLLEAGKLDIALVQGEVVQVALASGLRIVAAMYSTQGMFAVRGDSPYRAIADLRGKPVAFGARGSGLVILARNVLDGIGLDPERDFEPIYLERAGDGPIMLIEGRVAALWGGGAGWPGFTAAAQGPAGARFIAPDAADIARICAKHPFLKPMTLPAETYPGQRQAVHSVGSWNFVLARHDLDAEIAYRIARALHRGEAELAASLPQARETTAANTVAAAPALALINPGVLRYLREIGLVR